jgi:F-type H+-transporting ATPase subunit epsilon
MKLEIVTPEGKAFEGEATSVSFPGAEGGFEVLNNHTALVSVLKKGDLVVRTGNQAQTLHIEGGVAEVSGNKVTVLAEKISSK